MNESTTVQRSRADLIREKVAEGIFFAGLYLFGAAGLTLIAQAYLYLKNGTWPPWALFDLIYSELPAPFLQWLFSPQDWLGLHRIVAAILLQVPIMLDTIGLAFFCIWVAIKFEK